MANLSYDKVREFQETTAAVAAYPPGYIEGFRPVINKNLTVTVGGGVTTVEGTGVNTTETLITKQMWRSPYTGGDSGWFYYVYLKKDGSYMVDATRPAYSDQYFYYAHPAFGHRVILRLWMDTDEKIKYVSRDFRDTPRTVTVAPDGYVGEADYYCDGENDQIWIQAALDYANDVLLLTGDFVLSNYVTIPSSTVLRGESWATVVQPISVAVEGLFTTTDGATGVQIKNMKLEGPYGITLAMVSPSGATEVLVDSVWAAADTSFSGTIQSGDSSLRLTITNSKLDNISLDCSNGQGIVDGCDITDGSFRMDCASAKVTNNIITASDYDRLTVNITGSVILDVSGNQCIGPVFFTSNHLDDLSAQKPAYGSIAGNTFENCSGIYLLGAGVVSVKNNVVRRYYLEDSADAISTSFESLDKAGDIDYAASTLERSTTYTYGLKAASSKHAEAGGTAYLDNNNTAANAGKTDLWSLLIHGELYCVSTVLYVPDGQTPGDITFKVQAYDGSSWNDIDTASPSSNDSWEEETLSFTADKESYTGYRVTIEGAEEYYVGSSSIYVDSRAPTAWGTSSILPFYTDGTGTVTVDGNSWQDYALAVDTARTLTQGDSGLVVVDPSAAALTITLASPSTVKGLTYRIENRHYGNGLIDRGDCESTTAPMVTGETTPDLTNCTFARSDTVAHNGTYSYKITKNIAAGTGSICRLVDGAGTSDLHGLTAGATYTATAWVYVPSTGGVAAAEAYFIAHHYISSFVQLDVTYASETDSWHRLSLTFTLSSSATAALLQFGILSTAADTEFFYVDDIQLYRHYDVTVSGAIEDQTSKVLHNEGDYIILVSDGDKYLIQDLQYYGRVRDAVYLGGGEYQFPEDSELDYSTSFTDAMSSATVLFSELPANTRELVIEYRVGESTTFPFMTLKRTSAGTQAYIIGARFADVGASNDLLGMYRIPTSGNYVYANTVQADQARTFVIYGYRVGE